MFYSHQLLARKQPLGQIWMAATMHGKFSRKKLSKLNIINICEEILNPQVPMALRLLGILMEGVVIIYEKKVKLLQDDASHLLVEINQAWKVIPTQDPTLLRKGKTQAKYKDVTLPDVQGTELEEIEQSVGNSKIAEDFTQTMPNGYITVVTTSAFLSTLMMWILDPSERHHQADPEDITLIEPVAPYQTVDNLFDRFERFDVEGNDETYMNFASQEPTEIPSTLIHSPPHPAQPATPDEIVDQFPNNQPNQHAEEEKEPKKDQSRHDPIRRKPGKPTDILIDEQIIIPGPVYHTWLQDTSDIVSPRGGRKKKVIQRSGLLANMNIAKLMELPLTLHYPKPLLEKWNRCAQISPPSGKIPLPHQPQPSSPPNNGFYNDRTGFKPFEGVNSWFGSESFTIPIENLRATKIRDVERSIPKELGLVSTPENSGELQNSYHSSDSAPKSDPIPKENGRPSKKRPHTSARHCGSSLEPVLEENSWENNGKSYSKLAKIDEIGLRLDTDLFVETAPTQTQLPIITPVDHFTDAIKNYLKTHFDSPGVAPTESLHALAYRMTKTKAAQLFYQTCVLITRAFVRVEQKLSRGEKM